MVTLYFHFCFQICTFLGIGHVPFIALVQATSPPPCIQWGEPVFVSADVTNLMYNVSVSGTNSLPLTFTTSGVKYCPELTPCQEYTITVVPFSTLPDYVGASNSTKANVTGGICTANE